MDAYYVETKEEAVAKALELMPKGSTISWGGTMSVAEAGLMDAIRNGDYTLYDRDQTETAKEREEMMHQAFFADFFLGSTNAVGRRSCEYRRDGEPGGSLCVWSKECSSDRGDEQGCQDTGGCSAPGKK